MTKNALLSVLVLILFVSCSKEIDNKTISFYYWRTHFSLSEDENVAITTMNVKKLYIRYFDLDLVENTIVPIEPIQFVSKPENVEIIPVIFIKNRVFINHNTNIKSLAAKTLQLIKTINQKHNININEIQLDCDWNQSSKLNYFQFLQSIKDQSGIRVSATIRLHQIKYASKTGVPPMDYGVLMYYNMGKIAADNSNSIYNRKTALPYLAGLSNYPSKLTVALPIFSWMVHSRETTVIQVYNQLILSDFKNDKRFEIKNNTVKVLRSGIFKGVFMQENDVLKEEKVENKQLKEIVSDLNEYGLSFDEIILFDLQAKNIKHLDYESIR